MALIKCTECGKEFSDKAPACPNCGCPTSEMVTDNVDQKNEDTSIEEIWDTVPKKAALSEFWDRAHFRRRLSQ